MYGKMFSACLYGIEGVMIGVEIDLANGLPQTNIIGLPDSAIREAVERVRAAVKNCGYRYPQQRITINLAPADLRKEGSAFDLAIALGILITSGQLIMPSAQEMLLIGELALDGSLRPVSGVLPMVEAARKSGFKAVLLPQGNAAEAALISGMNVYTIDHLQTLANAAESVASFGPIIDKLVPLEESEGSPLPFPVSVSMGTGAKEQPPVLVLSVEHLKYNPKYSDSEAASSEANEIMDDYSDVLGQQHVKRALTIAAAGMHNIMLIGPPGTGKTMLIKRLPSILPQLSDSEALEVTKIFSAAGKLKDAHNGLLRSRPFRSPHHTISSAGLIGGAVFPSQVR